jgi:hypothetical protein
LNPKVIEQINGYLIEWPAPYYLSARVSRIRIPSDGQVRGELEIKHINGKNEFILLVPTQFNFSSEQTRVRFAKQLSEKLALNIEWKSVFDYLSQKVQALARTGDALVEVYPDSESPPPEQMVESLIYKGVQNIIYGEKGVSKSTLAYLLGMCVTLPWLDNPFGLSVPEKSVKALVLDWETDEGIFRYYLSRLQRGMAIPYCSLFYRRCTSPLMDDIEAIQKHIEDTSAELLIIDSLGAAAGGERGELKGSEAALLFNSALRRLKRTSLIIGQTRKGEDDKRKTIYGSTYFTYYARNIFELCASQDVYEDIQHLGLFHRECNLGKKMQPMGLRLEFAQDGGINFEREPVSVAEFAQKVSVSQLVLNALKEGAMTSKELKEQLDVNRGSIDMAVKRLRELRKIIDTGGKKWGLPVI